MRHVPNHAPGVGGHGARLQTAMLLHMTVAFGCGFISPRIMACAVREVLIQAALMAAIGRRSVEPNANAQ